MGPGLDIVGLAVEGPGDEVRAEWIEGSGVSILDPVIAELPREAERHASGLAALAVLRRDRRHPGSRHRPPVRKGLPLSGGQGGSAASAVAGAVAANALLGSPLGRSPLIEACLDAEEAVAGRHADNVAPALLGGIVLLRAMDPLDLVQLPVPPELFVVLVRPDQRMRTADARAVLPARGDPGRGPAPGGAGGGDGRGARRGDYELLGRAIDDRIAEPARAGLLPGFAEAKAAALEAGALGSSISGSGPTAFALVRGRERARQVAAAMVASHAAGGRRAESVVGAVDQRGARLTGDAEAQP